MGYKLKNKISEKKISYFECKCDICGKEFEKFRPPDECSICGKVICDECSFDLTLKQELIHASHLFCLDHIKDSVKDIFFYYIERHGHGPMFKNEKQFKRVMNMKVPKHKDHWTVHEFVNSIRNTKNITAIRRQPYYSKDEKLLGEALFHLLKNKRD
jgi:hypothetical protein